VQQVSDTIGEAVSHFLRPGIELVDCVLKLGSDFSNFAQNGIARRLGVELSNQKLFGEGSNILDLSRILPPYQFVEVVQFIFGEAKREYT